MRRQDKSAEPAVWARVQWGGADHRDATKPTHISSYTGILNSAMRPRWYRAVVYGPGGSAETPWVSVPDDVDEDDVQVEH